MSGWLPPPLCACSLWAERGDIIMKSACNTLTSSEVLQYSETSLNIQECDITLQVSSM